MLSLSFVLISSSMVVYASQGNEKSDSLVDSTAIIIKGEENIKAYEEAGIIRSVPRVRSKSFEIEGNQTSNSDFSIVSTSIPTSTWDLKVRSRDFTYSFMSHIYSNYRYLPARDSLSSTGFGIYHMFEPNSRQRMTIFCYDVDGDYISGRTLTMDDVTLYGLAVRNKAHYFKYESPGGTRISGSGLVY